MGISMLDDADRRILRQMQAAPESSMTELASRCNLSAAACWRRVEKLEASGLIGGQETLVDWAALGYSVEVSLRITLDKTQSNAFDVFIAEARKVPEVLEIQTFLGRIDVRLSIIARDMGHYQEIYRSRILTLPHISDIEALMHISRIKQDEVLPI